MRWEGAGLSSLYVCGAAWCGRAPGGSHLWSQSSFCCCRKVPGEGCVFDSLSVGLRADGDLCEAAGSTYLVLRLPSSWGDLGEAPLRPNTLARCCASQPSDE